MFSVPYLFNWVNSHPYVFNLYEIPRIEQHSFYWVKTNQSVHNHFVVNIFQNEFLNIYCYTVLEMFRPLKRGNYTHEINVHALYPLLNFFLISVINFFSFLDYQFNITNSYFRCDNIHDRSGFHDTYVVYNTLVTNDPLFSSISHVVGIYSCPLYSFFYLENSLPRSSITIFSVHNFYVKVRILHNSFLYFRRCRNLKF